MVIAFDPITWAARCAPTPARACRRRRSLRDRAGDQHPPGPAMPIARVAGVLRQRHGECSDAAQHRPEHRALPRGSEFWDLNEAPRPTSTTPADPNFSAPTSLQLLQVDRHRSRPALRRRLVDGHHCRRSGPQQRRRDRGADRGARGDIRQVIGSSDGRRQARSPTATFGSSAARLPPPSPPGPPRPKAAAEDRLDDSTDDSVGQRAAHPATSRRPRRRWTRIRLTGAASEKSSTGSTGEFREQRHRARRVQNSSSGGDAADPLTNGPVNSPGRSCQCLLGVQTRCARVRALLERIGAASSLMPPHTPAS